MKVRVVKSVEEWLRMALTLSAAGPQPGMWPFSK